MDEPRKSQRKQVKPTMAYCLVVTEPDEIERRVNQAFDTLFDIVLKNAEQKK